MCSGVLKKTRGTESEELAGTKTDVTRMKTTTANILPSHPPEKQQLTPLKNPLRSIYLKPAVHQNCRSIKWSVCNCHEHVSTRRRSALCCCWSTLLSAVVPREESPFLLALSAALIPSPLPPPTNILLPLPLLLLLIYGTPNPATSNRKGPVLFPKHSRRSIY